MSTYRSRLPPARGALAGVALTLVIAIDVVLLVVASRPPEPDRSTLVVAPVEEPSPPPAPTSPAVRDPALPTVARLLVAVDDRVAWRTTAVGCGTGSAWVERTDDGGATWTALELPETAGVLALVPGADVLTVTAIVAVPGCGEETRSSFSAGSFWRVEASPPPSAAYVQTADPARARLQGGESIETPCPAIASLSSIDDVRAVVVCSDAVARITNDAGATWTRVESVEHPLAVAGADDRVWIAETVPDCEGVRVSALETDTATLEEGTCVAVAPGDSVAISVAGGAIWVWGSTLEVVSDGQ